MKLIGLYFELDDDRDIVGDVDGFREFFVFLVIVRGIFIFKN